MAQSAQVALPKTLKWWINVGLVVVLAGLIFTIGVATAQHQADDQFIGSSELKRNVKELESATAETQFLTQYYQRHIASRPFVQAHGSQIQKAVDSISEKLQEHPHADALDDKVNQTIGLANQLSSQLEDLVTEPVGQLPDQSETDQTFSQLSDQLQNLEDGL